MVISPAGINPKSERQTMKKFIYMAVAAIAALSSCSNEDEIVATENGKGETTFFATMENDATTRVKLNDKAPSWESGDVISIDGHDYTAATDVATTGTFTGTGATESTHHAYYPASMYSAGTVTLPASYTYTAGKFDMPMYAESMTTDLSFKNLCGVLAITVPSTQMSSVSSIVVSSDQQMNGAISAITTSGVLTFASATLTNAEKKVTLTATSAVIISTNETFYVPVPAGTHNPLTITVSDGTTTKVMMTQKTGGVTIERNKIYPIAFEGTPHLLPGAFSVSATKTVLFTKSNLYWDGSAFHFEAKPTDYPTTRTASHVGHFFWTKDALNSYAASYNDGTNADSDQFFADGSDASHKLTADGVSGLYVLSNDEWNYLIGRSGKSKYGVTVNSVADCLVIAPDNFTGTITGPYTLGELDAAGLVCLPPAGRFYPSSSSFNNQNYRGYYWSSTPAAYNADHANYLVSLSDRATVEYNYRSYGLSLRVVLAE